jgi:hypothetical protein
MKEVRMQSMVNAMLADVNATTLTSKSAPHFLEYLKKNRRKAKYRSPQLTYCIT